ncbi:GIY-YIG nuclease family protein [Flavobacterium tructae]
MKKFFKTNNKTKYIRTKQYIMFNPQSGFHTYYVYIITNQHRSTFYIGVTNNLKLRLHQHKQNIENGTKTFASKYNIQFLVYYEKFTWIHEAITREKELKKWNRDKKLALIKEQNPVFEFLNHYF